MDALADIMSRHGNVRSVFCGHSHRSAEGTIAGVDASTIPSVASDLQMGSPADMPEVVPVYRFAVD